MLKKTALLTWGILILAIISTIGSILGMLLPALEAANHNIP